MTKTPNHNYNTPSEGKSDWHIPLNQNFEQLDIDVEIRGPEGEKGDHDPKIGSKYEATDSGAVYHGDGSQWILVDRKVEKLQSSEAAFGELWTEGGSGAAIVAPSYDDSFNGVQDAFDAGHRQIWIAEDVTENDIQIPSGRERKIVRGMGGSGGKPTITDPQDGKPVFTADRDSNTKNVHLLDFHISGGRDSGPAIDVRKSDGSRYSSSSWRIQNVTSSAGPWLLGNAYRATLINCLVENDSPTKYSFFHGVEASPSIQAVGTTFGIWGGTYETNHGKHNAMFATGGFHFGGGITFQNKTGRDDGAGLTFAGANNGVISGVVAEGSNIAVRMGIEGKSKGIEDSVFLGCGFGYNSNIFEVNATSNGNVILCTHGDINVKQNPPNARCKMLFITPYKVNFEGPHPQDIVRLGWDNSGKFGIDSPEDGYTQFSVDVVSSKPEYPAIGAEVIADGTNWDPDNDGNAEKIIYTQSGWVETQDLGTTL